MKHIKNVLLICGIIAFVFFMWLYDKSNRATVIYQDSVATRLDSIRINDSIINRQDSIDLLEPDSLNKPKGR